ncbi:MAG: tRNA-binding protein [Mycoplasmataceae bacterium]|jgi:tRNA-binding protein|nr:tRNA-binding protein [Mycoplasmataceae bacterium]
MLAIFYNKTTLRDTLLINFNDKITVNHITNDDFAYGLDSNNKLTFLNIFSCSKYLNIPEGYLYLDRNLKQLILDKLSIDLTTYEKEMPFKVGKVIKCELMPNTHLHHCEVDIGNEILSIVCGAPNVKKDINVVVAQVGAMMPNGLEIKSNTLRGYESNGMICSKRELMIDNNKFNNDGIIELSLDVGIGTNFMDLYKNYKSD